MVAGLLAFGRTVRVRWQMPGERDNRQFPILSLSVAMIASLAVVASLAWSAARHDQAREDFVRDAVRLTELRGDILYFDEALTMTARMAAASGDARWRQRYEAMVPSLDRAIAEARAWAPEAVRAAIDDTTRTASDALIKLNQQAFAAAERQDSGTAEWILDGREYSRLKTIYANGMAEVYRSLQEGIATRSEQLQEHARDNLRLSLLGVTLSIAAWASVVRTLRQWHDRTARTEARIRYLAHYDALTELPNRTLFRERLEHALAGMQRSQQPVAVMCIDLDRFKDINDTLGHPAGDALLRQVAQRLAACVRDGDTVARFGGDEFVIVQVGGSQPEAAASLARRLITTLAEPFDLDGMEVLTGGSIGIALAPGDGAEADRLLKSADIALFRVKTEGRGGFRFFEEEMNVRLHTRRMIEHDLRRALAEQALELHYQPQVDLRTGRMLGVEALLRWPHPSRGYISPSEFIPVAEETGLIIPLGEWVLRTACVQAVAWPGLRMAVNLSAAQFRQPGLDRIVGRALADSGLNPAHLELEITESILLHDTEGTLKVLQEIKALGVRIAMDDFGTGYSSLSYLRRFPFDKIKIDGSFIRDIWSSEHASAIVRAVVRLGQSLGMTTNAEGVESPEQAYFLMSEGCDEVQGYHFGRPMRAQEIALVMGNGRVSVEARN